MKPATLYAYVSRGLLPRRGRRRGSTFDAQEVARLARSGRQPAGADGCSPPSGVRRPAAAVGGHVGRRGRPTSRWPDPVFVTELTLIAGGRLFYRGLDAVELSRTAASRRWRAGCGRGEWPDRRATWRHAAAAATAVAAALRSVGPDSLPVERFMSRRRWPRLSRRPPPRSQPGRRSRSWGEACCATLVDALPLSVAGAGTRAAGGTGDRRSAARLWPRLSRAAARRPERQALLEAALVLSPTTSWRPPRWRPGWRPRFGPIPTRS